MRERDKKIIEDLEKFRVLSRDDIADLHFSNLKIPEKMANHVLKRLWLSGYITANTQRSPYVYFTNPAPIKMDSSKINHYLEIAKFYRMVKKVEEPKFFHVEANYGKQYAQPDAFMIWQNIAFYIEIQRSFYSPQQMKDKLDHYEAYFLSNKWKEEAWQGEKPIFPSITMISKERYNLMVRPFVVNQYQSVEEFIGVVNHAVMKRKWTKNTNGSEEAKKKAVIKINPTQNTNTM